MSFWHVLEWLQESFLTRGTIMYSWIAQKRSLGFLVNIAPDTEGGHIDLAASAITPARQSLN